MKKIFIVLAILSSLPVFAETVFCEGWFQNPEKTLEKKKMDIISTSEKNTIFSTSLHGYIFKVNWDYYLTTFYVSILSSENDYILGSTARVPTANHPENFTDLRIPGGPRLAVNCEMK